MKTIATITGLPMYALWPGRVFVYVWGLKCVCEYAVCVCRVYVMCVVCECHVGVSCVCVCSVLCVRECVLCVRVWRVCVF